MPPRPKVILKLKGGQRERRSLLIPMSLLSQQLVVTQRSQPVRPVRKVVRSRRLSRHLCQLLLLVLPQQLTVLPQQ